MGLTGFTDPGPDRALAGILAARQARENSGTTSAPAVSDTDTGQPFVPGAGGGGGGIQNAVAQEWLNAGYSPAAVQGIMRRVNAESRFDPTAVGDGGTSFGLYQHHEDRARRLEQFAAANKANPADPIVQTKFAIQEMNGGDPIAARHRDELMKASDPNQAYGIFTRSFERPAGAPGSEETNLHSTALGPFNKSAQGLVDNMWQSMRAQQPAIDEAISEAKDLHQMARAMGEKWMTEMDKPPQNMRQAWGQWSGIAGALALFGGALGGGRMIAAVNAAGEMLQAANSADQKAYDDAYSRWSKHLELGMHAIELLNKEADTIIKDSRLPYDQLLNQLQVLSTTHQLQQALDPQSVENQSKQLQLATSYNNLINAQNEDARKRTEEKAVDDSVTAQDKAWLA